MTELTDLSETDGDNTLITGANVGEGCPPSGINNAIRNIAGLIRRAFKASIFRVRDTADQTKLLAFDLSGLTTSTTRTLVVPDRSGTIATENGPTSAKWWAIVTVSGGTPTLQASYNVASINDLGNGLIKVNFTTAYATTRWSHFVSIRTTVDLIAFCTAKNEADATFQCVVPTTGGSTDPLEWDFGGFGTLA